MISIALIAAFLGTTADHSILQIEDGDTISIVGNTFAERMQHFPYFEAGLRAAYPEADLHVRNFAWSADEVALQPRPLNFEGMDAHLDRVGTDVLIACFGMNESFAGDQGLLPFRHNLEAWLDAHSQYRIVLVSPIAHETLGERWPEGTSRTLEIGRYTQVMREVAASRGIPFIDLHYPMRKEMSDPDAMTINGIHLNEAGYRLAAREMLVRLGIDPSGIDVPKERLADIREKNRFVFERFRPINTEYVYGRRFKPFGDDNFPREMKRLEDLAMAADRALLNNRPVNGQEMLRTMDPAWAPTVPEPDWEAVNVSPEDRDVPEVEAQVQNFVLPEGWSINCFASEEDFSELANPIAMNFDGDGRLWVVVAPTYPHVVPGESPRDRLIYLEDADRDGHADTVTTFADGLYIPTGFATNGDEAWVVSQPNLIYVVDTDGDGVADEREIVLHGFGPEDSHHAMSAFARPPDGSIYFQEGTFHHTQIESPHGPSRSTDGAVHRFNPHTGEVEVVSSWPWANPWGHVFDRWGRSIITDGTSGTSRRLTHIAGAHPYPDTGKGGPDVRSIPAFTPASRRPSGGTEILGGSHLPDEVHGRIVLPQNIGYHGLHWYDMREADSGFAADAIEPDLLYSTDPTCRPVDTEVGPDGAIYMLDWANPIVGHMQFSVRDPRRDHTHGRIWRITKDDRQPVNWEPISQLDITDLLTLLAGNHPWATRRSRIELQRRPADEVLPDAMAWGVESEDPHALMEALWLHQAHGVVNETLLDEALSSDEPRARAAAVAVMRGWSEEIDTVDRLKWAVLDRDPGVRAEALLALGYCDDPRALELLSLAMRLPMDQGMKALRARAVAALARFGEPGGEGTETWRLSRMVDEGLLAEPLNFFSAAERLKRPTLPVQARRDAAEWLASESDRTVAEELWNAVRASSEGGSTQLLLDLSSEELEPLRPELESVSIDATAPDALRHVAWAARLIMDGWGPTWAFAAQQFGPQARMDLLDAAFAWPDTAQDGWADVQSLLESGPRLEASTPRGRFVRIELDGPGTLTLAEVEILSGGTNVALGSTCAQSTTNWEGHPEHAVDGNSNGQWAAGTSTHTIENDPDPWWEVDLGSEQLIEQINIYNRTDRPYHKRLDQFRIKILDEDRQVNWELGRQPAPEFKTVLVPGSDSDLPVRRAAMRTLARAVPSSETLAMLRSWAVAGDDNTRMHAALAMDLIPDEIWPEELSDIRIKRIRIGTIPHKMMYDIKRFDVVSKQPVEIILSNDDEMPHNLVVSKPGSLRRIGRASDAQGLEGEAAARDYVPDISGILHASELVLPGQTRVLRFIAPERPGRYPYICTYPAHWQMMNGVMQVHQATGQSTSD